MNFRISRLHGGVLLGLASLASAGAVLPQSVLADNAQSSAHQQQRVRVALPAQALSRSLAQMSRQTGIQIQQASGLVGNTVVNAVNGTMALSLALDTLLAGTGITYRYTDDGAVLVGEPSAASRQDASTLAAINVSAQTEVEESAWGAASQGYMATHSATGTKTDARIVEIPQSVSVVTRQEMDDRGSETVMDAVRYTAGVQTEGQGIDSRVDDIRIRGFDASSWSNNLYLDGLRMPRGGQWTTPQIDAYGLERVEVLKGPAAVLYGQVAPGGLVNMVAKRPTYDQTNEVVLEAGSFDQYEGSFDVGGDLGKSGKVIGRLVGSYNDGDSQVDETELSRTYLAPSATVFLTDDTEITFLSYYQKDEGGSTFQFLPVKGVLEPTQYGYIDRSTFLGEPDWNTYDREQWAIGYDLTHYINDAWSFRQNAKYNHVDSLFNTVVSATFPPANPGGLLPDNRTINRRAVRGEGDLDSIAVDNQFKVLFNTGGLRHDVIMGLDYLNTDWTHTRFAVTAPITPIDVYDPVYGGAAGFENNMRVQSDYDVSDKQLGVYLQDLIRLDQWRFTVGARQDYFDSKSRNKASGSLDKADDEAFTWRAGATYLFDNGAAPYASYATSFEPLTGFDTSESPFEPSEGEQFELGVKYQPPRSNSLITLSVFDLTQTNLVVSDPNPPVSAACNADNSCRRQTGETQTRGVELEGKAWQEDGLSVTVSYTYLDAEITKETDATLKGNDKEYVPRNSAALWLDYKWQQGFLRGLGLGAGARFTDSLYGDAANSYKVDSYTLYDASVRYDMRYVGLDGVMLSLTGRNLADEEFLSSCSQYGCSYGTARHVTAGVSYRW
ncbi:TonB-dependent siderophore receptor [Alcanivorax sp.]|uniref:TonB-dependent siderophore receptor n=1 Tax=Alcanivorax sp. TaxID=1872427 RepID=UPI000C11AE14|nr:TonB-dependent siderophore receptor [Alcanivorax sp.]PHR68431.1 MAG: TonB-dependent siderophore receptor [Alcanivorax sp.]